MRNPCSGSPRLILTVLPLLLGLFLPAVSAGQSATDPCELGQTLYRDADFAAARTALRQCLDASGPDVEVLLPLTVMGVREGRLAEAVEYGAAAVELAPSNPEARYWYGRALLRAERSDEAKIQWESGLVESVTHLGILEGLARLALAEQETAKAYQLFGQMQRAGMQEPWLDRVMADIAAGKGLWAESLGHLQAAMTMSGGGSAQDLLTAAELSIMADDKSGAVAYCRQAVMQEPSAETYGGLGEAYFAIELVDSALVYLRMAVEQHPGNARFRFNLANALEVSGQVEEADYHFRTFLRQAPNDPVGHFNYAIHLEKMGRSAEALLEMDQAIALDPGMLTARVVRIQLLEDMGRWDEALLELSALKGLDQANTAQLDVWSARLISDRDASLGQTTAGKMHLQHMVLGSAELVTQVQAAIEVGEDFTSLVVQFSTGGAAARGGDIGWVNPDDMTEELRLGLENLGINEISPPIESKGLYHIFRRIP